VWCSYDVELNEEVVVVLPRSVLHWKAFWAVYIWAAVVMTNLEWYKSEKFLSLPAC